MSHYNREDEGTERDNLIKGVSMIEDNPMRDLTEAEYNKMCNDCEQQDVDSVSKLIPSPEPSLNPWGIIELTPANGYDHMRLVVMCDRRSDCMDILYVMQKYNYLFNCYKIMELTKEVWDQIRLSDLHVDVD